MPSETPERPNGTDQRHWYLFAAGTALLCGFFAWFPLTNTDFWWHLASAREMIARGDVLRQDPFTFTPTLPWVDVHWLYQLLQYAVYQTGGLALTLIVKVVAFGAACALAVLALRPRTSLLPSALLMAVCMYEARFLVLARPVLVTLVLMGLFLLVLERHAAGARARTLLWLLPLQVLWANTQGLFALGVAITGAYAVGSLMDSRRFADTGDGGRLSRAQALGAMCAGLAGVSIISPFGLDSLLFPLRLMGRIEPDVGNVFSLGVSENVPLYTLPKSEPALAVFTAVTALVTAAAMGFQWRKLRAGHALLFLGLLYLAVSAQRNILLFLFVAAPLLGHYGPSAVEDILDRLSFSRGRRAWFLRGAGLALALVLVFDTAGHVRMLHLCPRDSLLSPFRYPTGATEYLKAHPVDGRMFNSVRYGGYLTWHLYPPVQTFIDGRLILRTAEFYADYLAVLDHPDRFPALAATHGITHAVLPTAVFDRYTPLVRFLYHDPDWRLAWTDGASVVMVKADVLSTAPLDLSLQAHREAVTDLMDRQWRRDPAIRKEARGWFGGMVGGVMSE